MPYSPFAIGRRERDAGVRHMAADVRESPAGPADVEALVEYFEGAASVLVNRPG
jgi:hypothetical protein